MKPPKGNRVVILGDIDDRLTTSLRNIVCNNNFLSVGALGLFRNSLRYLPLAALCFWRSRFLFKEALGKFELAYGFRKISYRNLLGRKIYFLLKSISYALKASYIISLKPKIILTNIDNSIEYQLLDIVLHKKYKFLTIQNGNRYGADRRICVDSYEGFFNPPNFHSCLCVLSRLDVLLYQSFGWQIINFHIVGSILADINRERFKEKSPHLPTVPKYEIFVVLNSILDRDSSFRLANLIKNFVAVNTVTVCVGVKVPANLISDRDKDFIIFLYGQFAAVNFNNSPYPNLEVALQSNVVVGCYSTMLREVFSFGKKVYPINFSRPEFGIHFDALKVPQSPTQAEFNSSLLSLLKEDSLCYRSRYTDQIELLGAFPQDISPLNRLSDLICHYSSFDNL